MLSRSAQHADTARVYFDIVHRIYLVNREIIRRAVFALLYERTQSFPTMLSTTVQMDFHPRFVANDTLSFEIRLRETLDRGEKSVAVLIGFVFEIRRARFFAARRTRNDLEILKCADRAGKFVFAFDFEGNRPVLVTQDGFRDASRRLFRMLVQLVPRSEYAANKIARSTRLNFSRAGENPGTRKCTAEEKDHSKRVRGTVDLSNCLLF